MASKTEKIKTRLLWEHGRYCAICGKKIRNFEELTIDHIIPLSKGGKNELENCQLAHKSCNSMKSDKMPDVYYWRMKHNRRLMIISKLRRAVMLW